MGLVRATRRLSGHLRAEGRVDSVVGRDSRADAHVETAPMIVWWVVGLVIAMANPVLGAVVLFVPCVVWVARRLDK